MTRYEDGFRAGIDYFCLGCGAKKTRQHSQGCWVDQLLAACALTPTAPAEGKKWRYDETGTWLPPLPLEKAHRGPVGPPPSRVNPSHQPPARGGEGERKCQHCGQPLVFCDAALQEASEGWMEEVEKARNLTAAERRVIEAAMAPGAIDFCQNEALWEAVQALRAIQAPPPRREG